MDRYLAQGKFYESHRGSFHVSSMPLPFAERALSKLIRENGDEAQDSVLGRALARRIARAEAVAETNGSDS
jgi:hypothetical protein